MTTQTTRQTGLNWAVATVPGPDTPLAELRQLKQYWLDQARQIGIFEDCRQIAIQLGQRIEHTLPYPWDQHPCHRWAYEDIEITLLENIGGKYLPSRGEFEKRDHLTVTVGGHRVASYIFTNHPRPDRSTHLFIPGDWTIPIQAHTLDAKEHARQLALEIQEVERQALLEELLVGIQI